MFTSAHPIVLGSGSPRRREMLLQLGLSLEVVAPEVNEDHAENETPETYVRAVVLRKLHRTLELSEASGLNFSAILCADTVVVLDEHILQKPVDSADAGRMLSSLLGRQHQVLTGYALWVPGKSIAKERVVATEVTFRHGSSQELNAYVQSGEGLDKAGGYAVQGCGAAFVERISGSYTNVVGLPLCELTLDLLELGVIAAI